MSLDPVEAMDTSSPHPAAGGPADLSPSSESREKLDKEFEDWKGANRGSIIALTKSSQDDEGKASLEFSIGVTATNRQPFILHCPLRYPIYAADDDNFFVEAEAPGLQLWCNALNEYLLDTAGRLTLSAILAKGVSLYSSADSAATSVVASTSGMSGARPKTRPEFPSDDSDSDEAVDEDMDEDELYDEEEEVAHGEDEQLEDILDNDLSWELEIARRKKAWKRKETELREEVKNTENGKEDKTASQLYHDPSFKNRQPKQVFTDAGASGILMNDLVAIMESVNDSGIEADTIGDNIFQWNVKIRNFTNNCVLDKDFQELKSLHGYDFIELQLDFSMDLYPFFPPLVKVIRPRLQGSMMLRVTTMEILKLSYWNPARDMKSILEEIKSFLQTWARLDLQSERNDRGRYPDGAYIDIEHHLLRMALVSEIVPRANKKYVVTTPMAPLPSSAMEATGACGVSSTSAAAMASSSHSLLSSFSSKALNVATANLAAAKPSAPKTEDKSGSSASGSSGSGSASTSTPPSEEKKPLKKFMLFNLKGSEKGASDEKEKKKAAVKNMAKGVGYSSYQQKGWDVKAYMAAQKEKDKQIELVLAKILQELTKLHGTQPLQARNLPDVVDSNNAADEAEVNGSRSSDSGSSPATREREGSRRKRKHSPDDVAVAAGAAGGAVGGADNNDDCDSTGSAPIDPLSDLYAVLEGSALVPFLESKLQKNSFLEICSHPSVYKCCVNIIKEIASQPCLVSLLGPLPDQTHSIHSLLLSLENQARVLLEKIGKASANGSVPKSCGKSAEKLSDKNSDDKLARDFLNLSKEVTKALKSTGILPDINGESCSSGSANSGASTTNSSLSSTTSATNSSTIGSNDEGAGPSGVPAAAAVRKTREDKSAELYKIHMKNLLFDSSEFSLSGGQAHHFASTYNKAGTPNSQIIFRVAQELSSLSSSLPCDFSSAIFIRSDDEKSTLLRAMITGPEDTPYTGGCYVFDIYFPPKYPQCPPKINFRTTGGGQVRFNPNLYNCGKVCLSLLGTWEGAQGEQWNETSTILQVLISIQSLILCAEPYYNEPGFERIYGTPQGDAESLKYSEDVFRNNLKIAILGQLQNPPEGFEEVIKAHFFLKRHCLLAELEKKLEKFKSKDVRKNFLEVKRELMKLEQPPNLKKSFQEKQAQQGAD